MALSDPDASGSGSPRKDKGKEAGYLRVRIGVLERNRKDLLIRFDANVSRVSLPLARMRCSCPCEMADK
jgi:hypothetical protein